jgi:transposase
MTCYVGIDVAKDTLMAWAAGKASLLKNTKTEIRRYLKSLPQGSIVGVETTSDYHFLVAEEAVVAGFTVYVLNPVNCARYRLALKYRGKTDKIDAEMIARFVEKEHDSMRPFTPLPDEIRRLRQLLRRRDKVVSLRVSLVQTLSSDPETRKMATKAMKELDRLIAKLERDIGHLVKQLDGHEFIDSIPGVGLMNTACALSALSTGEFPSADAFVAFVGLDCRPKESGASVGRRAISRRGDRLLRKLLYLAALSASKHPAWKPFYTKHLAKGLSKTQAVVALARKIARTIWSVYTHRTTFQSERIYSQKMT